MGDIMIKSDTRKKITRERSLVIIEEVLNKYNETLFKNKDIKEYKSSIQGMNAIQSAWSKAFDHDKLQIVASIDLEEYIDKDNI